MCRYVPSDKLVQLNILERSWTRHTQALNRAIAALETVLNEDDEDGLLQNFKDHGQEVAHVLSRLRRELRAINELPQLRHRMYELHTETMRLLARANQKMEARLNNRRISAI